jgi:hypothetical protein
LAVGLTGVVIERTMLSRLYKLDHLYGCCLPFGLALIFQGLFTNYYGSSGTALSLPEEFSGAFNLGFMFLPKYRAWVILGVGRSLPVHVVRHRAHQARLVFARGDREPRTGPGIRHQRPAHDHADLRLSAWRWRRWRA